MKWISERPPHLGADRWKDVEWSLKLNWLALRMLGVWPEERHLNKEPLSVKIRIPLIICLTTVWVVVPHMWALYMVIDQLPLAIDNIVTNVGSITACAKYFVLWRYKQALFPVIDGMISDWLREKSHWDREVMIKHAAKARLFTVLGYSLLGSCYVGFVFLPLLGFNIRLVNNITDHFDQQRHLLFQSYYPFPYWRSPYYEMTELLQLLVGFFVALAISTPDNYYGMLVFHLSAQMEILVDKMQRSTDSLIERDFSRTLGNCIDRHVQLVETIAVIERAFCLIMLAQVMNMSLLICCIGFQLIGILETGMDKETYLPILTLIGIIGAFAMNTLVDCYASETLATANSRLFDSVYNCSWYIISASSARNLRPMMLMSLYQKRLTAGKIFQLSMSTYCNLLRSAGGYITTLLAVTRR